MQGDPRLWRGDLPQRLVFRARSFLQRHQGPCLFRRLWPRAQTVAGGTGCAAAAGARRGVAVPADASGRFPQRPAGGPGQAQGSAGIRPQAALSAGRYQHARLRRRAVRAGGVSPTPVIIHTDGACSGNPGPGGWGAILKFGDVEKELKGGEVHTTNNRMELMAAISALEALKKPCIVDLYTDSQSVPSAITACITKSQKKHRPPPHT